MSRHYLGCQLQFGIQYPASAQQVITKLMNISAAEDCCVACGQYTECAIWTYVNDTNKCWLKMGNLTASSNPDSISGGPNLYSVPECYVNNGGCEQQCQSTDGVVTCSCNTGYILSSDNKTCIDLGCQMENGISHHTERKRNIKATAYSCD
ncbi:zinc metalloproteinase nas-39-like [Saccoglossus kowalevskii]